MRKSRKKQIRICKACGSSQKAPFSTPKGFITLLQVGIDICSTCGNTRYFWMTPVPMPKRKRR